MQLLSGNIGLSRNHFEKPIWGKIRELLKDDDGILAYKIPSLGSSDETETPSFIYRSKNYGIIIIDVVSSRIKSFKDTEYWINSSNDDIYSRDILISNYVREVKNKLSKSTKLYDNINQEFKFDERNIHSLIIFPDNTKADLPTTTANCFYDNNYLNYLVQFISDCKTYDITDEQINEIDSILEGTSVFNKKRFRVKDDKAKTRNDLIQKSLQETFKLDSAQRSVALQVPNGPQRVRGLAGTGKTIILSMKAALTHLFNPNFKILFVFNTQSMYNQIINNIQSYTISESNKAPNWDNIKVMHAWGGRNKEGIYSYLCSEYGLVPKTFYDTKGQIDPYEYIFKDFLNKKKTEIRPEFDMVLIDEAQDFPTSFFETIYYITKDPKRIIWAYDEFQSLNDLKITSPSEIFGLNDKGKPNLDDNCIDGKYEDGIDKDYMLSNSYRNPRKVLMCAHGLGLGLYSDVSKLPMKDKHSWEARGYQVLEPSNSSFGENENVEVIRPDSTSKNILELLVEGDDSFKNKPIISYKNFDTVNKEIESIIKGVRQLIKNENIEPEEILIISLDKKNAEADFRYIRTELNRLGIECITPGFIEKSDKFKEKGKITLVTPFRAKGNETNIVFVMNAQQVIGDRTLRNRNALFVSITRSRGWCFITGNGEKGKQLKEEVAAIESDYPKFKFTIPLDKEYNKRMEMISRSDKALEKTGKKIDEILNDDLSIDMLIEKAAENPELLKKLKDLLNK